LSVPSRAGEREPAQNASSSAVWSSKGRQTVSVLWIIIIIIVVLALLGYFGRGRMRR
jgi:hypothetical protein